MAEPDAPQGSAPPDGTPSPEQRSDGGWGSPWMYAIFAAAVLGLFLLSRNPAPSSTEVRDLGPVVFRLLGGGELPLSSLRGKVVLVNFWATWCPPCVAELPELEAASKKYGDRLAVVGVSVDDGSPEEVRAFARRHGVTYPIARVSKDLRTFPRFQTLPTTFMVGCDGKVRSRVTGGLRLSSIVAQLERTQSASAFACKPSAPASAPSGAAPTAAPERPAT